MNMKTNLLGLAAIAAGVFIVSAGLAVGQPAGQKPAQPGAGDHVNFPDVDDSSWTELASREGSVKAETRAWRDSVMRYSVPTEIREIVAVAGQRVKKGDVLVRARDADVAAALETQRFQATNDTEVKSNEAQNELARFRLERGQATRNLSPAELKELEIQVKVSGINVEAAQSRLETERLKLKYYEGQYERYRLEAPFDGEISEMKVELGQGVTDQQDVLRIVNIDRLRIDAWPATDDTLRLRLAEGSKAWVMLKGRPGWIVGKVMYVNAVADSVSQTRQVRVEVDNPEHFPAGTPAIVRFTEPTEPAGQPVAAGDKRRASR